MKEATIVHFRLEPYPHDYLIDRLFLWWLPSFIQPNHLTLFRMLATPLVLFLIINEQWDLGVPVFLLVAFTDVLDGSMARIRRRVTAWGTLFDPLADKLLIGGILLILVFKYVDRFIGGAILFLELTMVAGAWLKKKEGLIVGSNHWGKTKMGLQVAGIGLLLLSLLFESPALILPAQWVLILSILFGLLSILSRLGLKKEKPP